MSSNPYFNNNPYFNGKAAPQQAGQQGQGTAVIDNSGMLSASAAANQAISAQRLQQSYDLPNPTHYGVSSRMTIEDVVTKTATLLAVAVAFAALTWVAVPVAILWPVTIAGALIGMVLGLIISFRRSTSPALILSYAVAEGFFLGGISKVFDAMIPGIVLQAVLATAITFGVTLALYRSGKVRATPKMKRFFLIAMLSYAAFCVVNLFYMIFGSSDSAFGMRTEIEVAGIPLGVIVGIVAVLLGVFSLIMDFDFVQRGVEAGAPAQYSWAAGFGIMVTLIWLYIEFLRLFAILASNR